MAQTVITELEVIRAGDIHLVSFECPSCKTNQLEGLPIKGKCKDCSFSFEDVVFDLENAQKRNLAVFTDKQRNNRKKISKATVRLLFSIQDGRCAYCEVKLDNYHVDHVLPIAVGGTNLVDNLVLACPTCNQKAGAKAFKNFMHKRNYILTVRNK